MKPDTPQRPNRARESPPPAAQSANSAQPAQAPRVDAFPRLQPRRRLLIVLLAVATAVTVVLTLLHPPGGVKRVRPPAPAQPLCAEGQTSGCVGGKAMVILPAPAAPGSAPR